MPSTASSNSPSRSGIATSSTGERLIPASTRADGSVRKEIRVRPGYRPPEDVEVYKNRTAEAWKNRGKGGVPGAQFIGQKATKDVKRRPKTTNGNQRAESSTATPATLQMGEEAEVPDTRETDTREPAPAGSEPEPVDPEVEKEREARKLSKKLRQAKDLQRKKENGDALLPEQFEKVIRINELIRQLDSLGFNAEGEKKA